MWSHRVPRASRLCRLVTGCSSGQSTVQQLTQSWTIASTMSLITSFLHCWRQRSAPASAIHVMSAAQPLIRPLPCRSEPPPPAQPSTLCSSCRASFIPTPPPTASPRHAPTGGGPVQQRGCTHAAAARAPGVSHHIITSAVERFASTDGRETSQGGRLQRLHDAQAEAAPAPAHQPSRLADIR